MVLKAIHFGHPILFSEKIEPKIEKNIYNETFDILLFLVVIIYFFFQMFADFGHNPHSNKNGFVTIFVFQMLHDISY